MLLGFALGNRGLGRLRNGAVHRHQPVAGIFHMGSHRIAGDDFGVGFGGPVLVDSAQSLLDRAGNIGHDLDGVGLAGIGIANAQQGLVALGVQRVGIHHSLQARNGSGVILPASVIEANLGFALGQNLLHVAQLLLGAGRQRRVREQIDHRAVLPLGVLGVRIVAVRLLHLLVVDVAHLHLRLGGFRGIREEGNEVLVLGLGLSEGRGAALLEPGVAHGQLGAHPVLGVGIGVEHGLQVKPRHVVAALLHGDHGLVEELLVGLPRFHAGQRVDAQILVFFMFGLLLFGLGRNCAQQQNRQSYRGNLLGQPVHNPSLRQRPRVWPYAINLVSYSPAALRAAASSARASRSGCPAPKTALPATSSSAPAWTMRSTVS